MGNAVTVHLIRHEKTKANLERKYIGWTNESIYIQTANCQVPIHTKDVFGSDLKRRIETAQLYFPRQNTILFSIKGITFWRF